MDYQLIKEGLVAIASGIAVVTGLGAGVGIGIVFGKANEAIARQPELQGRIMSTTILGAALAESTAIYGLVVSLYWMFAG